MSNFKTTTISVPGAVWSDFLDPLASGMAAELELPDPNCIRRGKGYSMVYENVTHEQAREVAEYLRSRGELLLSNSDPYSEGTERGWYRSAVKTADKIEASLS